MDLLDALGVEGTGGTGAAGVANPAVLGGVFTKVLLEETTAAGFGARVDVFEDLGKALAGLLGEKGIAVPVEGLLVETLAGLEEADGGMGDGWLKRQDAPRGKLLELVDESGFLYAQFLGPVGWEETDFV